jgi:hypothetical protein
MSANAKKIGETCMLKQRAEVTKILNTPIFRPALHFTVRTDGIKGKTQLKAIGMCPRRRLENYKVVF